MLRDDQGLEVGKLFAAQRRLGNTLASEALEEGFVAAAFFQRPLQDSDALVGDCPFEGGEKRTARRGYSFELFRFLSRLNALTLSRKGMERLTPQEVAVAAQDFGRSKQITFHALRRMLVLDASYQSLYCLTVTHSRLPMDWMRSGSWMMKCHAAAHALTISS